MSNQNGFHINNGVLESYNGQDTQVVITDGVEQIGSSAFGYNLSITSVVIPGTVRTIGAYAFSGCEQLREVIIADGVEEILSCAFDHCLNLETITIPESVTRIGTSAFKWCANRLINISLPTKLSVISQSMFENCFKLQTITIPKGVHTIERNAFKCCKALQTITIPHNVKIVGEKAFTECDQLHTVVMEEGVETIRNYAFKTCKNLRVINLPVSIKSVDREIFADCPSLQMFFAPDAPFVILETWKVLEPAVMAWLAQPDAYTSAALTTEYQKYVKAHKKRLLSKILEKDASSLLPAFLTTVEPSATTIENNYIPLATTTGAVKCSALLQSWGGQKN